MKKYNKIIKRIEIQRKWQKQGLRIACKRFQNTEARNVKNQGNNQANITEYAIAEVRTIWS